MDKPQLNVLWMYPDVLNLHGDRGNIMALMHVAELMQLDGRVRRCDSFGDDIPWDWADLIFFNPGEVKNVPRVAAALQKQRAGLDAYVAAGKMMVAIGTSGAVLGRKLQRHDGTAYECLGLLDMVSCERRAVYGDDLWFALPDGQEVMGTQIQLLDTQLEQGQQALGRIIYGHGNNKTADEGARSGNIIFSNCLGPVLVKNPAFAAALIADALAVRGVQVSPVLNEDSIRTELLSFELIKKFVQRKMPAHSS